MQIDEATLRGIEARVAQARKNRETGACIVIGCDLAEAMVAIVRAAKR